VDESSRVSDLVASLLSADADAQIALLRTADVSAVPRVVAALGRERSDSAARALALIDGVIDDRAARKAARRELHRLHASGIRPPDVGALTRSAAPAAPAPPAVVSQEAWATAIDSEGARRLWLVGDRALGGVWLADLVLEDIAGLTELELIDTTRKRFQRELSELRRDPVWAWVQLPVAYAKGLVGEGVALARELEPKKPLPTHYPRFTELFGEPPADPGRPLVYETVSPVEARLHPDWLELSDEVLSEPEVAGWALVPTPELSRRAIEVARSRHSAVMLPGNPPERQAQALLDEAARELVTPAVRRGLRRRLEETASIFQQSHRPLQARRAVAAATHLGESGQDPADNPLVRGLVLAGLLLSVGDEQVAGQPVPMVLLDIVAAAYPPDGDPPHPSMGMTTRPSGLILPR